MLISQSGFGKMFIHQDHLMKLNIIINLNQKGYKMQVHVGKSYRIIGEVSEGHGDCKGDVISCAYFDEDGDPVFNGLKWIDEYSSGDYLLVPNSLKFCQGDQYQNWLATVLEEV